MAYRILRRRRDGLPGRKACAVRALRPGRSFGRPLTGQRGSADLTGEPPPGATSAAAPPRERPHTGGHPSGTLGIPAWRRREAGGVPAHSAGPCGAATRRAGPWRRDGPPAAMPVPPSTGPIFRPAARRTAGLRRPHRGAAARRYERRRATARKAARDQPRRHGPRAGSGQGSIAPDDPRGAAASTPVSLHRGIPRAALPAHPLSGTAGLRRPPRAARRAPAVATGGRPRDGPGAPAHGRHRRAQDRYGQPGHAAPPGPCPRPARAWGGPARGPLRPRRGGRSPSRGAPRRCRSGGVRLWRTPLRAPRRRC